jgi:hypothetical protein
MRSIFYQIYTGRLCTTKLLIVQSRKLFLLKYVVHLFHPETINVSTVCNHGH